MGRLQQLHEAGVSIWLDTLSRELLETGEFERLVREFAVTGATSNPTIFAKAITNSDRYDAQLRELVARGLDDPQALFLELALEDIRQAAEVLRPTYERSLGADGFISLECTPDLADDTDRTIEQALDLWNRLELPNALIKVPATAAGVTAIEELTARGVNVNVTLLFSVRRYEQVIEAYLRGLERRAREDEELGGLTSVASFFVSRVDTKADARCSPDLTAARADRDRQRQASLRPLPAALHGAALGAPGGARCQAAAPALGEHRDQEPRLLRRALRRAADRARGHQHDARCDAPRLSRSRDGRAGPRRRRR